MPQGEGDDEDAGEFVQKAEALLDEVRGKADITKSLNSFKLKTTKHHQDGLYLPAHHKSRH